MGSDLTEQRHEWLDAEIRTVLASGAWMDNDKITDRVRKRWSWAAPIDVWSALDRLWEEDEVDQRTDKRKPGAGSVDAVIHIKQWRLLPKGKAKVKR